MILGLAQPARAGKPQPAATPASAPLDAWVLVRAGARDVKMSGNTRDIRRARAQQQNGESLLYVRRAGKAYVIRDNGYLDRMEALWAPVDAQGKKMDALGKEMDPLGKQMDALGKRMERAHDDAQRDSLGKQMDELGRQMDVLGRQMDALGKDMDRLAKKAEADLAQLVDEAIRAGKATDVKAPL
jgi:outer membrane murein-binding lipoprotein Lpp